MAHRAEADAAEVRLRQMKPAAAGIVRILPVTPKCQTVGAGAHPRANARVCEHKHRRHGLCGCFVNMPRSDAASAADVYKDVTGSDY